MRAPRSIIEPRRVIVLITAALTTASLVSLLGATGAWASKGCENEARRVEQNSTFLPDCRAYELVSQPSQPTPRVTSPPTVFVASTGFEGYSAYSSEPAAIPEVETHAYTASGGDAALYEANEANSESFDSEYIDNLSRRGTEGWSGSDLLPLQSNHAGWAFCGTTIQGIPASLEWVAVKLGGGGTGQDYQHCGHDEPYLFTEAEGESRETSNMVMRNTESGAWSLLSVYPLGTRVFDAGAAGSEPYDQYNPHFAGASADGSHAVFTSQAQLTPDAPNAETYLNSGANDEFEGHCSTEFGNLYLWSAGADHTLAVTPDGIPVRGTLAGAHATHASGSGCEKLPEETASFTDPISAHGDRILFYAGGGFKVEAGGANPGPNAPYIDGGLYLREHPGAGQSALAHGGAAGTGTLTAGSSAVGSLRVTLAAGLGHIESGSNELTTFAMLSGKFAVGQTIEGQGIPVGTTVTEITEKPGTTFYGAVDEVPVIVLSNDATENIADDKLMATSEDPAQFAVGQTIVGRGIPVGTTIVKAQAGELTLSNNATASGAAVSLESSSECTEAEKACTLQVDVPEEGATGVPGGGQFQWANAETTKIFFTDQEKLTTDSTAEPGKPDLYEYDVEKPAGQRLTDLTTNAAEPADVLGVTGASEDGSYVYFIAQASLTGSQQNSHGAAALGPAAGEGTLVEGSDEVTGLSTTSGAFAEGMAITGPGIPAHTAIRTVGSGTLTLSNAATESGAKALSATAASLYLRHEGMTTFIATLNAEGGDQCDWTAMCLTSRVSQNGRYIAFDSIDKLTGYDNMPLNPTACNVLTQGHYANSSEEAPCIEAYRYAAASGAHGELTCATCNPKGRPEAEFPSALVRQAGKGGPETFGDQIWLDHPMTNDGEFIFETEEPLVKEDENSRESGSTYNSTDVYEYTGGEGPSAQYHLISTGKSEAASEFLDASSDGSNVFFETAESLLNADTRSGYDIYDARVDGGLHSQSAAIQGQPCESVEGCLSPATEPPAGFSVASAALVGSGNLQVKPEQPVSERPATKQPAKCRKGFVRRNGKCVRKHQGKPRKHRGKPGKRHGKSARRPRRTGK